MDGQSKSDRVKNYRFVAARLPAFTSNRRTQISTIVQPICPAFHTDNTSFDINDKSVGRLDINDRQYAIYSTSVDDDIENRHYLA